MENREKAEYLDQYTRLNNRINRLINESEEWYTKATKTTPTISDMPHGGNGEDQRELAMAEMADCDIAANKAIDQLCTLRGKIAQYIAATGDCDEKLLATLRVEK